jgi:glycosyltransferase involved in cell wall biosynthesis
MKSEVIAIIRMGEPNAYYLLKPISMCRDVSFLHIIRPKPPGMCREIPNSRYYEIKSRYKIVRFFKIYHQAVRLAMHPEVRAIVSFFAFPYGLIAVLAGLRTSKPVHIGFVGDDWYRYCLSWYGGFLNWILRKAQLITVTGNRMKKEMTDNNYQPKNIFHLPHAVDVALFKSTPPEARQFDCIFVGDLIQRKRVDLIILAMESIKKEYRDVRLCIVGDGPLREALENEACVKGLKDNIKFVGRQERLVDFYSDAMIIVIASDMEGFPFALVEGIVSGAVPVSTNVGTIADIIEHGKQGLLSPPGDAQALGENILRLITDKDLYMRMRSEVLKMRNEFCFENVSELWTTWIGEMERGNRR